jgi:hypothetical protein
MKTVFAAVAVPMLLLCPQCATLADSPDTVACGRDRLTLAAPIIPIMYGSRAACVALYWRHERHLPAGRPFRSGVELSVTPANRSHSVGHPYVHVGDVFDVLDEHGVGYFVDKIETERDFIEFLFRFYDVGREDWIMPDELPNVFTTIAVAPAELRFKIVSRDVEPELLKHGVSRCGGVWTAAFVAQCAAGVFEFKFAIDSKNRVGYHERTLIQGPPQPIVGAGMYTSDELFERERAFEQAFLFLRKAIESAKAEKRTKQRKRPQGPFPGDSGVPGDSGIPGGGFGADSGGFGGHEPIMTAWEIFEANQSSKFGSPKSGDTIVIMR